MRRAVKHLIIINTELGAQRTQRRKQAGARRRKIEQRLLALLEMADAALGGKSGVKPPPSKK